MVDGSGCRIQSLCFRVQGSGIMAGCGIQGLRRPNRLGYAHLGKVEEEAEEHAVEGLLVEGRLPLRVRRVHVLDDTRQELVHHGHLRHGRRARPLIVVPQQHGDELADGVHEHVRRRAPLCAFGG